MKKTTMEKMTTEAILIRLTGITRKPKEGIQRYLRRVLVASDTKISDAQYDRLPDKVADWLDNGTDAIKNKKSIPLFPEVEESGSTEAVASDVNKPKEDATMKPAKKVQPTKKAKTKAVAKATKPTAKAKHLKVVKKESFTTRTLQIVSKKPTITLKEVKEQLTKEGLEYKDTTTASYYYIAKKVLKFSGMLK
jgi:hypothetical protein